MAELEINRTQALHTESSQSMVVKRNLLCALHDLFCARHCAELITYLITWANSLHLHHNSTGEDEAPEPQGGCISCPQAYGKWVAKQGFALKSICPH